jgi:hypothetical protein
MKAKMVPVATSVSLSWREQPTMPERAVEPTFLPEADAMRRARDLETLHLAMKPDGMSRGIAQQALCMPASERHP